MSGLTPNGSLLLKCRRACVCKHCGNLEFYSFVIGQSGMPNWLWLARIGEECPCGEGDYSLGAVERCCGFFDAGGHDVFEGDIVDQGDNFKSRVRYGCEDDCVGFYLEEMGVAEGESRPRTHSLFSYATIPDEWRVVGHSLLSDCISERRDGK